MQAHAYNDYLMNNVVRLKDVAAALGINPSTVSRALNDLPSIPKATRERVKAKAAEMNYRPDPSLRRLAERRWAIHPSGRSVSMAFVAWSKKDYPNHYLLLKNGIRKIAEDLGYGFESLYVDDYPDATSAARVLKSRGVAGIIAMASKDQTAWQNFPWNQFSSVQTLTGEEAETGLSTVRYDTFWTLLNAGKRILKSCPASAAICLIEQPHRSKSDELNHSAALQVIELWKQAGIACPPPQFFKISPDAQQAMVSWLAEEGVHNAIVPNSSIEWPLKKSGIKTPEQIRLIALKIEEGSAIAGYRWQMDQIALRAVQQVDSMIRHDETGSPAKPETTVIPCLWVSGKSFPEPTE